MMYVNVNGERFSYKFHVSESDLYLDVILVLQEWSHDMFASLIISMLLHNLTQMNGKYVFPP